MASTGCPDASALQSLLDGELGTVEREAIHAHADACEECRRLLAALASLAAPGPAEADVASVTPEGTPARAELIVAGTRIGRYEVETLLGVGGWGTVYAARDPELGRRVALKLLKSAVIDRDAQLRLMREAQAMARVAHPNVLAVYDAGPWRDRLFVAMELNDGGDLRAWLVGARRTVSQIVDVFAAAGRGLAAAHAVALVHRDFKPDNVLVSGDGRVRVADFGLARAVEQAAPAPVLAPPDETALALLATTPGPAGEAQANAPRHPSGGLVDSPLTHAGTIMGTPAYMAPEQHLGEHVDARSDQFAFSVALAEALYGERPFAGDDYPTLRENVLAGRVRPAPRGSRVPASLRRIVLRGLAPHPVDRWPTMDALLAALGRDRTRVPRWIIAIAAALLAVVATALTGDWIVRARLYAVARASFAAKRAEIAHTLGLQYEAFSALAELSTFVPMMRQVAATRDQADFGLGPAVEDAEQVAALHATMRDADWGAWGTATRRGQVAVSDYKGRLLYTTGDPARVGDDVRGIAVIAAAYRAGSTGTGVQLVRADDPGVIASGILGTRRAGLHVVFVQASVLAGVPQAMFIQTIEGRRLLEDLRSDAGLKLALVLDDGSSDGDLPDRLVEVARRAGGTMVEIEHDGRPWLVQGQPLPSLKPGAPPVATLVFAKVADVGLAGLFPHARRVLLLVLAAGVLSLAGASWALRSARS